MTDYPFSSANRSDSSGGQTFEPVQKPQRNGTVISSAAVHGGGWPEKRREEEKPKSGGLQCLRRRKKTKRFFVRQDSLVQEQIFHHGAWILLIDRI
nr:hypothetical protein Itr_chr13CG04340 [Ipomoea trifida]